jgi:RNA polymerase sigma-70 factor (ECF subfamily)
VEDDVEEDLLEGLSRGEPEAYRELVERLEKPLVNFIFRFVGERHAAEDLFQETFVRVVRTLSQFRPEASLTTWIYTIARNLSLDWLKAKRRHRETGMDQAVSDEGGRVISFKEILASGLAGPEARTVAGEDERRVVEALATLAPPKREALVLRVYAGLSYSEIAKIVDSPVGTVKFRIHEAIQDLAKAMGVDGRSSASQGG